MDESAEAFESPNGPVTPGTPSGSARTRRKTNSDGLRLTNSGRVSMSGNKVNEKYNASYRNSENTNRLLGRLLSLGQACGIVGVALFGADILYIQCIQPSLTGRPSSYSPHHKGTAPPCPSGWGGLIYDII